MGLVRRPLWVNGAGWLRGSLVETRQMGLVRSPATCGLSVSVSLHVDVGLQNRHSTVHMI